MFFLAVICVLLGLRDQNFYVLHLLPANYNWAVAYRFLVLMITLQPCFLLLLLQSLYEKLAKPIVVRCYAALYAVLAAAHFILPTQDIAPLSRIGYYLSMPFFLYLVVQLIGGSGVSGGLSGTTCSFCSAICCCSGRMYTRRYLAVS